MVKNPKVSKSNSKVKNDHRWCMFLSLNNDNALTSRYIKAVTYELHASFKQQPERVTEPPFLLSRNGWGTFMVQCTVELVDDTCFKISHYLVFDDRGDIIRASLNLENDVVGQLKKAFAHFHNRGMEETIKNYYSGLN